MSVVRRQLISHRIEDLIPALGACLDHREEVLFAYVFGSFGRGTPGPLSDVDVAVYVAPQQAGDVWALQLQLVGLAVDVLRTDEVDLVVLNEADLSLAYQVIKTGRLLCSKDENRRIEFEVRTVQAYLDAAPLRQRSWEALVTRIREGRYGR